jgi:HSP20 family molecular chaperone IbpA
VFLSRRRFVEVPAMPTRDPAVWMWAEACELLDRAERLQRQFFRPARAAAWEPPADVFETEQDLLILVALPGVAPDRLEVGIVDGAVIVVGERPLPAEARAVIRRLEIPHGRFERRIALPAGRYEVAQRELANGCLVLRLRKSG